MAWITLNNGHSLNITCDVFELQEIVLPGGGVRDDAVRCILECEITGADITRHDNEPSLASLLTGQIKLQMGTNIRKEPNGVRGRINANTADDIAMSLPISVFGAKRELGD